jgi:hypothetical protein
MARAQNDKAPRSASGDHNAEPSTALKKRKMRRSSISKLKLLGNAQKALALKQKADAAAAGKPASQTAGEGMRFVPSEAPLPVERQGERPVLERSKKSR